MLHYSISVSQPETTQPAMVCWFCNDADEFADEICSCMRREVFFVCYMVLLLSHHWLKYEFASDKMIHLSGLLSSIYE